jgi:cytochrome c-type biogenesis protein CcmE
VKPAYIIAFLILAVSLVATLVSFSGAIAQHVSLQQAMTRTGETVQVPGDILKDTVHYDSFRGELRFDIVDKTDRKTRMTVVYPQPKPENFDSATSVEAVGRYKDGVFRADNLLIKCPSKYSDEKKAANERE